MQCAKLVIDEMYEIGRGRGSLLQAFNFQFSETADILSGLELLQRLAINPST